MEKNTMKNRKEQAGKARNPVMTLIGWSILILLAVFWLPGCFPGRQAEPEIITAATPEKDEQSRRIESLGEKLKAALDEETAIRINIRHKILAITLKSRMTFARGSANILPKMQKNLGKIAGILTEYPDLLIRVEGHVNNTGNKAAGMEASRDQAMAIRDMLLKEGVKARKITAMGIGGDMPRADNKTKAGRRMNRRIRILIEPAAKKNSP